MKKKSVTASLIAILFSVLVPISWGSSSSESTGRLIVLLSDYGKRDYYVGALKGSIYSVYPNAIIDDITHHVTPFNIWEGAYTLFLAAKEFPKGTVFIAVVDPGVGTGRKAIVLQTKDGNFFVAPDNGLLTFVAEEMGVLSVREIKNRKYMRPVHSSSTTFHGRDIFGPVGAHLAAGVPMSQLGPEVKHFVRLKIPCAQVRNGKVLGQVLRIDHYGNAVTNIGEHHLKEVGIKRGDLLNITFGEHTLHVRFVRTYGDVPKGEKLCHLESRKLLEIAINMGHLARTFGISVGDQVFVHRAGNDNEEK